MAESAFRVGVACEDEAHFALVTRLADGVLRRGAREVGADYIHEESLGYYRTYAGLSEGERYYKVSDARRDIGELDRRPMIGGRPIRLTGHFGGKPGGPDAIMWRRVFALFLALTPPPAALVVVRDIDSDPLRRSGLAQALEFMRTELRQPFPVIVALPDPEAEAWFVAGFVPANDEERRRLAELVQELSFDPTKEPHRLSSGKNATRDAKRILRVLVFDENMSRPPSRDELPELCDRVLEDLERLEQRGASCGLAMFLVDLRRDLVPLLVP